ADGTPKFRQAYYRQDAKDVVAAFHDVSEALRMWDSRSPSDLEWFETSLQATPTYSDDNRAWEVVDCKTLRELEAHFGSDFSDFMTMALEGQGSIIVVGPLKGGSEAATAVMLVDTYSNEPCISRFVTKHGQELQEGAQLLALQHVNQALAHLRDQEMLNSLSM